PPPPPAPQAPPAPAYEAPPPVEPPRAAAPPPPPPAPQAPPAPAYEAPPPVEPPRAEPPPPPPAYEAPPPVEPPRAEPPPPPPAYEAPPPVEPPRAEPPPPPPAYEAPPPVEPPRAEPPPPPPAYEAPPPVEPPRAAAPPPAPPAPEAPPAPAYEAPPAPPAAPEPADEPPAAHSQPPAGPEAGPVRTAEPAESEADTQLPAFMPSLTGTAPSSDVPLDHVAGATAPRRVLAGTALGDAMLLWQLGKLRRRRPKAPESVPHPVELSLQQTARMDSLRLIEAAMRQLRAVTIAQFKPKPSVVCVRTGSYGFEVLLDQPVEVPEGWQAASGGYVLELRREVTLEQLDAAGQGPSLCPALVPVGDTAEGPLLLNLEEIGCLAVSGPADASASLLASVVEMLGSSPLAGSVRIITVGVSAPSGPGWERIHATSFDSPRLEHLLTAAHSPAYAGSDATLDVLVVGPGNDILFQRAGQIASSPGSRLVLVGATSSPGTRWPWRIQMDELHRAVVHPIAVNITATRAMTPELSYLLSEAAEGPQAAPRL
ncbi:MAG: hypothetical protein OXG47_06940, partial [bacterium]|nr:hypothetical protein [bacterium]